MKKSIFYVMMIGVLVTMLFGCGKGNGPSGEDGIRETKREGTVYVPEYAQVAFECDYIDHIAAMGDTIFASTSSWDEETNQRSVYLYQYDLMENKAQQLPIELDENSSIYGMAASADGILTMVIGHYEYIRDENDEIIDATSTMELRRISVEDGAQLDSMDLTDLMGGREYVYVQYLCLDAQGNLYMCDGDGAIYVLDKDFQKICELEVGDRWISSMVTSKEGDVYVSAGGELKKIDLAGKKLSEPISGIIDGWVDNYFTGLSQSLLTNNNNQVSTVDLSAGSSKVLFKWIDVDVNADNVNYVGELSDGRICAITMEYNVDGESSMQMIYLSSKDASEVEAKEEIVFGTMWLDSNIRKNIVEFNKNNSQYRIIVKEYGEDDYETGLIQLGADMTTGNCPDIINLSHIDFAQYANKGVLEDLYPYMEKSGIKKEDYLDNILKAYEINGKLYGIMPKFYISSITGKSSIVGDEEGWTLTQMLDLVEEVDPPYVMMYDSRSTMLWYCIYQDIDEFIDWETGKCFFDGEDFIRALEFADEFPDDDYVDYSDREGTGTLLRENKVLLMQNSLSSVQEYQMMKGLYGEDITYVGFPNNNKKGNLIESANGSFGMSSRSKYKDGAWEFMKMFIEEEYQDSLVSEHGGWGFPVRIASLEKQFEQDMKPNYYEDEDGNQVENPKTTWGYDDVTIEIMAATQEEIDEVRDLIRSAERISGNTDQQIVNIITEEAEPFFKGQKSAADTANVIQNRVQIYVNENR